MLKSQLFSLNELVEDGADDAAKRSDRIIGYLPGLYPDRVTYRTALEIVAESGIRVMEIGIPGAIGDLEGGVIADALRVVHRNFPSPLDVITRASQIVIEAGLHPIVMAFRDTVFGKPGREAFIDAVIAGGASLVLVPDVDFEEYQLLRAYGTPRGVGCIPFVSATGNTPVEFSDAPLVYVQTADMPTGGDFAPSSRLRARIQDLSSRHANVPVGVGFGIRTGDDVTRVFELGADFAIIGTAMVEALDRGIDSFQDYLGALVGKGEACNGN